MSQVDRILDLLPPAYSVAPDSAVYGLLNTLALELEALQEDIDRVRRTHWVRLAYDLADLEKIGRLAGVERFAWETLPVLRTRLLATVRARLAGALGPGAIKAFVYEYLTGTEQALDSTFVPGLRSFGGDDAVAAAFDAPQRPLYRPLQLLENPPVRRRSAALLARAGRIPYLFRWQETNNGLADTTPCFMLTGLGGGRTAVPIIANLTTGELIGFRDVLRLGQTLEIRGDAFDTSRGAQALLNGRDATNRLFSVSDFIPGVPFDEADFDATPLLPRLVRGLNRWLYLSVGFYDTRGLDNTFFAIADERLREGAFNESDFNHALFPGEQVCRLDMTWTETEPASFEVRVPRFIVDEPAGATTTEGPLHTQVAQALEFSLSVLHAAGVRAAVRFEPLRERQEQRIRAQTPWVYLDPETAPAGVESGFTQGARFGESGLDRSRFE